MTTCETCNDTHSMSLRGSLVPCTRCPTPCQECRINGRGAYCAKTPCACACHAIVDRPAPTPTPAPGLDLDAVDRVRLHAAGIDVAAEHVKMLQETIVRLGAEVQSLRENGDRLAREVYASRHDTEAARAELAAAKSEQLRMYDVGYNRATDAAIAEIDRMRAKLAEAKRLGLEAHRIADDAIGSGFILDSDKPDLAAIAAALEAL